MLKKKTGSAILAVITLLLFVSAAGPASADTPDGSVYTHSTLGFSMTLPPSWADLCRIQEKQNGAAFIHIHSENAGFGGLFFEIEVFAEKKDFPTQYTELSKADGKYFYAVYPGDIQSAYTNPVLSKEYSDMYHDIESILATFRYDPSAVIAQSHTNSIGMEFVVITAGSFMMGSDKSVKGVYPHEMPQHRVTISKPLYMGKFEATQAQWTAVMGDNPSEFKRSDNPVENVSWDDVQEFIQRLNAREEHTRYRLPTEAEWEYAARAGTDSAYSFGDDTREIERYAWIDGSYDADTAQPVGQKHPNPWGLYDMYGNVWEWVADWFDDQYYSNSPTTDPQGPSSASLRVFRGGCWFNPAEFCRSALRNCDREDSLGKGRGFRLVLSLE